MNSKKANWAFLITTVFYLGVCLAIAFLFPSIVDNVVLSNLLCELAIVFPIMIFMLVSKEKPGTFLRFRKIKFSSILMIALFTLLSMPALTLLNLITQIWVENEVAAVWDSYRAAQKPVILLFLSVGIIAPAFEEITCRGAYYHSYRKSGSAYKAMLLSALIFALFHMNFNQAAYAFVMGMLAVLLVEATGSLWSSILYHGFINGSQVILIYKAFENIEVGEDFSAYSVPTITTDLLLCAIAVFLIITAITLPLAWAVLMWIAGNEGKSGELASVWSGRKEKKDKMITIPFVLALILCVTIMTKLLFSFILKILQMTGYLS